MLVDDWDLTQLSSVFLILPIRLYRQFTGGTDGLILFMRRLFVGTDLLMYWVVYFAFRKKMKAVGVAAATLFCADILVPAMSYFNLGVFFLTGAAVLTLPGSRRPSSARLISGGLLFACAVLCEPMLCAVYFFFSLLVSIRTVGLKRGKDRFSRFSFIVNGRSWLFLTVGVAAAAAAFFIYLQLTSGLADVFRRLPELFSSEEFKTTWYGSAGPPRKLRSTIHTFSPVGLGGLLLLLPASLIAKKRRCGRKTALLLFLLALLGLAVCYGVNASHLFDLTFYPYAFSLPVFLFGAVCCILCEKKDDRMLALFAAAAVCSLAVDYMSIVRIGFAGRLAYFPALFFCARLLTQLRRPDAQSGTAPRKKLRPVLLAAPAAAAAVLFICLHLAFLYSVPFGERPEMRDVARGPLQGLRYETTQTDRIEATMDDLDRIGTGGGSFYCAGQLSWAYLYLDRPAGIGSVYFYDADSTGRAVRYWSLAPERRPEYIYIPRQDDKETVAAQDLHQRLVFLGTVFDHRTIDGNAGYLLKVDGWKLL